MRVDQVAQRRPRVLAYLRVSLCQDALHICCVPVYVHCVPVKICCVPVYTAYVPVCIYCVPEYTHCVSVSGSARFRGLRASHCQCEPGTRPRIHAKTCACYLQGRIPLFGFARRYDDTRSMAKWRCTCFRLRCLGLRVWGLGFGVQGLGVRVWGSGFGVRGLGFRGWGSGFEVQGLRFRVWGSGFGVQGFGFRV